MTEKSWRAQLGKIFLTLVAVCLTFVGPTYAVLLLEKLGVSYPFLTVFGFILFLAGLVLIFFLVKEKT